MPDGQVDSAGEGRGGADVSPAPREAPAAPPVPVRVLIVGADPPLFNLLAEWLAAHGCSVAEEPPDGVSAQSLFDIVVVDIPFPRHNGLDVLKRLAGEHPDAAILVLSSSFLPGIRNSGAVARGLGVAGVLPKPVMREALVTAVSSLRSRRT